MKRELAHDSGELHHAHYFLTLRRAYATNFLLQNGESLLRNPADLGWPHAPMQTSAGRQQGRLAGKRGNLA